MEPGNVSTTDPQFSVARILRPYTTFSTIYEGLSAATPIQFTERSGSSGTGGQELDPSAGESGYSDDLIAGLKVPYGARVVLFLPTIFAKTNIVGTFVPYTWRLVWRLRNVHDYLQQRVPFHYPKSSTGVPDTTGGGSAPRVVIPAALNSVLYRQTEPGGTLTIAQHLRGEDYTVSSRTDDLVLPRRSTGGGATGAYQQGLFDPAESGIPAKPPAFIQWDVRALGDELLIGAYRATDTYANWGFGALSADNFFGQYFGATYVDLGVYAFVGVAP